MTLEGKMIGSREEIAPAKIDEIVEEKPEEDIIIDLDNPEEPIVVVEDERTIQTRELNTELLALQDGVIAIWKARNDRCKNEDGHSV